MMYRRRGTVFMLAVVLAAVCQMDMVSAFTPTSTRNFQFSPSRSRITRVQSNSDSNNGGGSSSNKPPKIKTRSFIFSPKGQGSGHFGPTSQQQQPPRDKPKLVLIGGCPGTGKSTFGMSIALDQGILKCISTDTIRAVMRSFIPPDISPALHRSSYAPAFTTGENGEALDDPVRSWRETCTVLEQSVQELVQDALNRNCGLVLEGVSMIPSRKLIDQWEAGGGTAVGVLLTIQDEETHKSLLHKRGFIAGDDSGQKAKDLQKLKSFDRVRIIQNEMIRSAQEAGWLLIEQKVAPDPLEIVADRLFTDDQDETNSSSTEHVVFQPPAGAVATAQPASSGVYFRNDDLPNMHYHTTSDHLFNTKVDTKGSNSDDTTATTFSTSGGASVHTKTTKPNDYSERTSDATAQSKKKEKPMDFMGISTIAPIHNLESGGNSGAGSSHKSHNSHNPKEYNDISSRLNR